MSLETPSNGGLDSLHADILVRAKSIFTLQEGQSVYRSLAVRGDRIWALSENSKGLNSSIGPETKVIDEPDATVLPAFDDTHTHLIFAGLSQFDVPVHEADSIPEMLKLIQERVSTTEPGSWICTTTNWQDYNLREQRLPTLEELDSVSTEHPIIVKRGGHTVVANSPALRLAGITSETPSPQGGLIGRDEQGRLNGLVMDSAVRMIDSVRPSASREIRIKGLEAASASYAMTGTGCVRDCFVSLHDLALLKEAHDSGKLHVRVRALITTVGMTSVAEIDQLLSDMEQWRSLQTDTWLSVWGVKFMVDGGIEGGATEEPYCRSTGHDCGPPGGYRGILLWNDLDTLVDAMDLVIRRGWRIGTHAYGDRAVRHLLDAYERVLLRHPNLPSGTLVIEHGGLATAGERSRAAALGIPVTIQQPLLHDVAAVQAVYWGEDRVSRLFPAREWLDIGALVAGGSDYPVGSYGPMRSVWGMTSRQTVAGVKGPEHAISPAEAIALHTTLAARLLRESDVRGMLTPGRFADLTIWPIDPSSVDSVSDLRDLSPLYTIIGGHIKHSP